MMTDSSIAVRLGTGSGFCLPAAIPKYRPLWCSVDVAGVHVTSRRPSHSGSLETPWNRFPETTNGPFTTRKNVIKHRVRSSAEHSVSGSDPVGRNEKQEYHPFEDIADSISQEIGDARLTAAETTRTIIEVNSKAMIIFSGMVDDVHQNVFWPDLPYVTDEHGDIYFQVNDNEDIIQSLTSENNYVQVMIGLDMTEMMEETDVSGPSVIDFGIDEIEDEDIDGDGDDDDEDSDNDDDDEDENWVAVLDDEDDDDDSDSDETLGDWAKLDTMRSTHPMYFAKSIAEFTSDKPVDWMDQPPAGISIDGVLRPAFIEEQSVIQKHISDHHASKADLNQVGDIVEEKLIINGQGLAKDSSISAEESEKDESFRKGTSFYKLEMNKIQLISAHGLQTLVEEEDFRKASPDAIAHSAGKIISRLKAGGEKTTQALKSLCWRCRGIQAEEATLFSIDSLGFDLRVCSGAKVETLRFAFNTRATSEYSAERQLNDLLFPRMHHKLPKQKQTNQKEC